MGEVLIQIDGWDPVAAAAFTLNASSVDDPAVCHLNGLTWWPALITLPKLRYDLFDGAFTGRISTPGSSVTLATEPWPNLPRWTLADARIRIWTGNTGDPWPWTLRFDGRVTAQPKISEGLAEISFAVDDRWLDTPLLTLFAGTGNAEGPASLKGTPKPLALGAPRFVPGVLIDPIDTIFMLSGYGQIEQIETVFERVLRFGGTFGDYPGFATLDVAPIPAGRWANSLAAGLVRFGAPLAGKQSFHMRGDKAGPDGWARKPGQLIRRIALLAGGAGKINDASLNALDAARPYNLSLYVDQQTTARDLIQRIAASVNSVAGVSWLGQLFVAPVALGVPALTLAADGSALPAVASVEQIEASAPWWRLSLQAERTWTVHELADVAFQRELVDRGAYAAGTTYREGDLVQDQNSSWIYINPTPTSGNAPPALPTTASAYWKVLASQGPAGTDGITIAPASAAFSIACDPEGTPKAGEFNKVITFVLRQGGGADLAADANTAFDVPAFSGCTVALSGSRGQTLTISAMSADSAFVDVRAFRFGVVVATVRVTLVKARDGLQGGEGDAGADGFTIAPASAAFSIACASDGTPKPGEFNKVITFTLRQGSGADLAGDAGTTFTAPTIVGCTAALSGTRGQTLTISAIAADSAYVDVVASRGGTPVATVRVTLTKAKDGISPGPNYASIQISGGTSLHPDRIVLNDGQSLLVEARYRTLGDTVAGLNNQLQVQVSPAGQNSWSVMTGGANIQSNGPGDPVTLGVGAATFTNTTGITQSYQIRAVVVNNGGGTEVPERCFLRAY